MMPKAWFCIPSARPISEADALLNEWRSRGYGIAVFVDAGNPLPREPDVLLVGRYHGYAAACNQLCRLVMARDSEAVACICGGDDIHPSQAHTADQLADEFIAHFNGTLGVMHCAGDGFDANGCCLICPWFGREYIRRAYNGHGPWCEAYPHFFVDKEGFDVAMRHHLVWIRREVS